MRGKPRLRSQWWKCVRYINFRRGAAKVKFLCFSCRYSVTQNDCYGFRR